MKSTGIIRRIDDLGRIVIPKEIRKQLRIRDGDDLEIYINDNKIVLQKYSNIKSIGDIAQNITDSIYYILKETIIITDTENIIAVSGNYKKDYLNKHISNELFKIINNKKNSIIDKINIVDNINIDDKYKINIIIENGDVKGSLILISNNITKEMEKIIDVNTIFLNKYLEE